MDKIQAILDSACELFSSRGFDNTPVSEIAKHAGVASGTVIYHFKTKDNLLQILSWRTWNDLLRQSVEAVQTEVNGMDGVRAFIRAFFAFVGSKPEECLLQFKHRPFERSVAADMAPDLDLLSIRRRYVRLLEDTVARGLADGSINASVNPSRTVQTVFASLVGAAWIVLFFNGDLSSLSQSSLEAMDLSLAASSEN